MLVNQATYVIKKKLEGFCLSKNKFNKGLAFNRLGFYLLQGPTAKINTNQANLYMH